MKFQLERISLFSDAVFAIAITLMMIEVKPPHLGHNVSMGSAVQQLLGMMPTFVGVILSFYLIGMFWKLHHELMKYMAAYNQKVLALNLGLLLAIAFIPFSTAFVFENIEAHSPVPMVVYNLNYIIATFLNYRLFNYILDPKNNLRSEHFTGDLKALRRERLFPIVVYSFVLVLAFFTPEFAGMGYALFILENFIAKDKKKDAGTPSAEPQVSVTAEASPEAAN